MTPFFSVILPTYGRADMLPRSIHAVRASLFMDFELIVVDDGSPEDVYTVKAKHIAALADPRVHLLRREVNGGCSAARNTGLAHATGKWIAYADDDDEMVPTWLTNVALLVNTDDVDVVLGDVLYDGKDLRRVRPPLANVLRADKICTPALVHRATLPTSGWDESFPRYADDEFINRCVRIVGEDRVAVTPYVASLMHTGHKRLTTSFPSLDLVRRVHQANPQLWWTLTNDAIVICDSLTTEQAVLTDEYSVGAFFDFVTVVADNMQTALMRAFVNASPAVAVITSDEHGVWPLLMRKLANGAKYATYNNGAAPLTTSGEGMAMLLKTIRNIQKNRS